MSCYICALCERDERYKKLWAGATVLPCGHPKTAKTATPISDCIHFGHPTGDMVRCTTCAGAQLKVFSCGVYGRCTISKPGQGVPGMCRGCPKKETRGTVGRVRWAYGVTTVPKRGSELLPNTVKSLASAGFDRPRIFLDGASHAMAADYERKYNLEVTARGPTPLKTVGNWVLALWELLVREPRAERFAIFQDDLVVCRDLRGYLDRIKWPDRAYLNLYTFPQNQALAPADSAGRGGGFYPAKACSTGPLYHGKHGSKGLGAVALCFTREAVLDLLSARDVVTRPLDAVFPTNKLDGCIAVSMNKCNWWEYVHDPSLVQHVGEVSSMGNNPHPKAVSFRGEGWSALELLGSAP